MGVFRKYGADSERIWTLIAALTACLLALAVWLHPLWPEPLWTGLAWPGLAWLGPLDIAIAALLIIALIALAKARRTLGWAGVLPVSIALCRIIPFPWSSAAVALLLIAFLVLTRLHIADALLPVRAYFIRRKAQKR